MKPRPGAALVSAALLIAALATSPGRAAPAASEVEELRFLQQEDARVAAVAHRLATANREACGYTKPLHGLVLYAEGQFGPTHRPAARQLFRVGQGIAIGVVVPATAAARAGVQAGDVLVQADGAPIAGGAVTASASFQPVQAALDRLDAALSDGQARLEVLRGTERLTLDLTGEPGCGYLVQLVPSQERNASADGRIVTVTSEAAVLARGDDELAALVAHELAHNILRHRERLDAMGRRGRSARIIRASEDEADRLSIHLLVRAGFRPDAAIAFWDRFVRTAQPMFHDGTHRGAASRVALIQTEVAAVQSGSATPTDLAQFTRGSALPVLAD